CDHRVQQVQIKDKGEGKFAVDVRVKLISDTFSGEKIDMLVNEEWELTLATSGQVTIDKYAVTVL
ncbi:hypothetical protein, partial [Sansalvadorimonas verongulae]|uniref:hypothetical protein n=1 Tax=Sansalvadorimonas verongulae TaxID=2172824 RepID=UPI001E51531C